MPMVTCAFAATKPEVGDRMEKRVKSGIVALAFVSAGVMFVPADARIEKLAGGFGFVEGPIWVRTGNTGYLLFSDIPANQIKKWTPDGKVSVFLEKSGFTGTDPSVAARD